MAASVSDVVRSFRVAAFPPEVPDPMCNCFGCTLSLFACLLKTFHMYLRLLRLICCFLGSQHKELKNMILKRQAHAADLNQ